MNGCETTTAQAVNALKLAVPSDLSVVSAMQFKVNYQSGADIGGTCSIPGWVRTYSYKDGKDTYTMPQCNWRAFKTNTSNSKQGWK